MRLAVSLACYSLAVASSAGYLAAEQAVPAPVSQFTYQTDWLKLPAGLVMGEIVAVAIDARDHAWVLHRPRSVKDRPATQVAPPITEFDAEGHYLRGFGGSSPAYEWPSSEHTLALATNGDVWITGNNRDEGHGDDMLLVFRRSGAFVRQTGRRGATKGNFDTGNFHAPADVFIDGPAHEALIADGYGNQRVAVLDSRNGRFKRMWGAFGKPPPPSLPAISGPVPPEGPAWFNGVHGVEKAVDGTLYVSDRGNQRIQAFTPAGKYRGQVFINRGLAAPLTASGITFSKDRAQRYLFVADWGNGMIVVIDRSSLTVLGTIGKAGTAPGEFKGPHLIDTDSRGVIYVAEVQGRRLQRLIPAANAR